MSWYHARSESEQPIPAGLPDAVLLAEGAGDRPRLFVAAGRGWQAVEVGRYVRVEEQAGQPVLAGLEVGFLFPLAAARRPGDVPPPVVLHRAVLPGHVAVVGGVSGSGSTIRRFSSIADASGSRRLRPTTATRSTIGSGPSAMNTLGTSR